MTNNNFKLAHSIAKVLTGNYAARIQHAWTLIKGNRLNEVSELIDLETLQPKMFVSQFASIEASKQEQKATKKPKKVHKQKKAELTFEESETSYISFFEMPMNIIELFGHDVSNTCKEMIQRYREHANKLPHEYRLAKKFNFNDGMQALANVQTLLDLQGVMCAFFLRDYITKVANKTIQLGVGYKLKGKQQDIEAEQVENITMVDYDATNETRYAWDNAPSNAGNITQYDASDITQEVIMLAYTKMFSEKMFDNPANVIYSLFFRISNAVQKMMNQLKRETQVRTKNGMYVQEAKSTIEDALWLVDELGFIGEEATVLKLALQDYAKKEINQIIGKRTDRTFKRLEKAFQALA